MTEPRTALPRRPTWLVAVLVVLQLATLPPYAASGLLLVPVLTVAVWVAVLTAGDLLLGWTA
jgi:hypothetical protein